MRVQAVPAEKIPKIWPQISPLLEEIKRRNSAPESVSELKSNLMSEQALLITFTDDAELRGIIVAYFLDSQDENKRMAAMGWMWGKDITNLDNWEKFVKIMRRYGVHEVVGKTAPQVYAAWKEKPFWKKYNFTVEGDIVRANIWGQ